MNEVYCKDCGKMYEEGEIFMKNVDGTILCKMCFDKRVVEGDIE
jgi:formylmethanofuran dehydrogenase subunit E